MAYYNLNQSIPLIQYVIKTYEIKGVYKMANRIKQLREEQNMTQVRLSIELEVSQETISAYESGKHLPSVASLIRLSEIFHTSCDYILGLSDYRDYPLADKKYLSYTENNILETYRKLPSHKKELLCSYLQGLAQQ